MDWNAWLGCVAAFAIGCGPVVGDEGDGEAESDTADPTSSSGDLPITTDVDEATSDPIPMPKYDVPPTADDLSGPYLFALSASIDPNHPLQWIANVDHDTSTGAVVIELQSLSLDQGSTTFPREPVGDVTVLQAGLDDDGRFGIETPEIFVTGAANPITGSDLTASLVIEGQAFGRALWCGEIFGQVTSPLVLDLAGSTFAFEPVDGPALPDPVLARCPD